MNGSDNYRVMGDMRDDPDENLKFPIDSVADMDTLSFCTDCFSELGWAGQSSFME